MVGGVEREKEEMRQCEIFLVMPYVNFTRPLSPHNECTAFVFIF